MLGTIRIYREVAGRVPDFHVDVLLVQDGLMLVDLGDFGSVVENEPSRHVAHNQSWKFKGSTFDCSISEQMGVFLQTSFADAGLSHDGDPDLWFGSPAQIRPQELESALTRRRHGAGHSKGVHVGDVMCYAWLTRKNKSR